MTGVLIERDKDRSVREGDVNTQGEDRQAKERGLRRNELCQHLDLGLAASKTEKFLLPIPLVCGICYSSFSRLITPRSLQPSGSCLYVTWGESLEDTVVVLEGTYMCTLFGIESLS